MDVQFIDSERKIIVNKQSFEFEEDSYNLAKNVEEWAKLTETQKEIKEKMDKIKEQVIIHALPRRQKGEKTVELAFPNGVFQITWPVEQTYDPTLVERVAKLLGMAWFKNNFTTDKKYKPTKSLEIWIKSTTDQKQKGNIEEKVSRALDFLQKALRVKEKSPSVKLNRPKV